MPDQTQPRRSAGTADERRTWIDEWNDYAPRPRRAIGWADGLMSFLGLRRQR